MQSATPNKLIHKHWVAVVLILIGAASYGLLSPIVKVAYQQGWNDQQITASQMTYGTLVLWLLALLNPRALKNPFREPWIKLSLIGIFGLALTNVLLNYVLTLLSATLTIVLLFQFTWITMIMEALITRKMPSGRQWAAALVIWVGTIFAVGLSLDELKGLSIVGLFVGLGSAITYSIFLTFAGRVKTSMSSVQTSAVMLTASLPFIYLVYPPAPLWSADAWPLLGWGALLGFLGQVLPTICFTVGIPVIGSTLAAVLGSVELPVSVTAALLIAGETVRTGQWGGVALIIAGMALAEYRTTKEPKTQHSGENGTVEE
ncbi:DMT family transporter [Paenibacillus turpanensis]|uniref:DMT family transporter n=1 Tax=Paenibacillus turpanensis TaxID=2689078 RepID=UPI001FB5FB37|nr:DMT family transporter [Paenibacillus turpanensis]